MLGGGNERVRVMGGAMRNVIYSVLLVFEFPNSETPTHSQCPEEERTTCSGGPGP
jgi:hypothetical protein